MKKKLLTCVLLLAGSVFAQPPKGSFNWWDSELARDINVNDEQRLQIRTTVREFRSRLVEQRAAVERAEVELDEVFNADSYDPRRANDAIEKLALARADLTRSMTSMFLKLRFVLTPQQWQELQKKKPLGPNGPAKRPAAGAAQQPPNGH